MQAFFEQLWMILVESSLWLIVGFAIAGAIHALVPRQWMLKHLSGGGFWPVAKASMLGIPLPLCSCSVIPVAAGLRSQGASKGASAAFAISTPQTGEESIPITWALFGPVYAFTRPIVAVITALIAGLLIDATAREDRAVTKPEAGPDAPELDHDPGAMSLSIMNAGDAGKAVASVEARHTEEPPKSSCCGGNTETMPATQSSSCCATAPAPAQTTFGEKVKIGFKHGFGTMLIDLAVWLTIGLLMAAAIGALVPEAWIAEHIGTGIMPKLIMLLVGIPLYICATSSTPLAWSLVAAGLSPGAALVMLLSGPATNMATMSWLIKDLGMRALVIYLAVIAVIALAAGIIFDAFFSAWVDIATRAELHDHAAGGFGLKESAAVLFILMMAWALGMRARQFMNARGWGTTQPAPAGGSCCSSGGKVEQSCGCH
ncbi:MAG: SO_0444 family Cu/Zn efflux transporter [Phycisphaerales bacterium]